MRDEQALVTRPATPAAPLTLVSELDGSIVTVGTQPGIEEGTLVVVIRLQSSLLDVLTAAYLLPMEARRLADALTSTAVSAAVGARPVLTPVATPTAAASAGHPDESAGLGGGAPAENAGDAGIEDEAMMHTVTASEGASAAELRDALGTVPPDAELVDFGADTEVVLVFAPASGTTP
jgi:uncharacterized repeat protein (TIGR03917 family)